MKAAKKQQRTVDTQLAKLKELFPDLELPDSIKVEPTASPVSKSIQGDSVLIFLDEKGKGFKREVCPECKQVFAARYLYRTKGLLCSDECRIASLAKRGIRWDPTKEPNERWQRRVPIIVPPQALALIDEEERTQSISESTELPTVPIDPSIRHPDRSDDRKDLDEMFKEFGL